MNAWDGQPTVQGGTRTAYGEEVARTDWQEVSGDAPAWREDVMALRAVTDAIKARVQALDDAALLRPFPGESMPAVHRIIRMATHDIYHSGQIRYLRALQGC